jgi:hypothetical protein
MLLGENNLKEDFKNFVIGFVAQVLAAEAIS